MLGRPQLAGPGVQRGALHVAVAVAEDLRSRLSVIPERIAGRRLAFVRHPQDLAAVIAEILRALHFPAIAERHVQPTLAIEHETRAEVQSGRRLRLHPEQDLNLLHAVVARPPGEFPARQLGSVHASGVALRVGPVDPSVPPELGVHGDVEQAALPLGIHAGPAVDRPGIDRSVLRQHAETAGAFGDQHASIGQEHHSDRTRVGQARGDRDDPDPVFLGGDLGLRRERHARHHVDAESRVVAVDLIGGSRKLRSRGQAKTQKPIVKETMAGN